MARKTFEVAALRDKVNTMIAAPGSGREARVALAVLIESVLFDTGNYHGFNYLSSETLPEHLRDYPAGKILRDGYDDTRRFYY